MKKNYFIKTAGICFFAFIIVLAGSYISNLMQNKKIASAFKIQKVSLKPITLVNLQLQIKDNITIPNGTVLKTSFNGQKINLKKADNSGKRAYMTTDLVPGKYIIKWEVKNSKYQWPKTSSFKKVLQIEKGQENIHILIKGRNITIS
jgi:hypothetical protein